MVAAERANRTAAWMAPTVSALPSEPWMALKTTLPATPPVAAPIESGRAVGG